MQLNLILIPGGIRRRCRPAVALGVAALAAACATGPPTRVAEPPSPGAEAPAGLLVMAHGGGEEWNRAAEAAVAPLAEELPVAVAFGMADPDSLERAIARLEAAGTRRIAVVRLFVYGGAFLDRTERLLGLRNETPASGPEQGIGDHGGGPAPDAIETAAQFALGREGLADSPLAGLVLRERVRVLSEEPERESVLILAHGIGDEAENARLLRRIDSLADSVRALASFRSVRVETLREDWAEARTASKERIREHVAAQTESGGRVIVVPFRVHGFGPYESVLEGLDYVADGRGLLPHAAITEWIRRTAAAAFCSRGWANPLASCRGG